MTDTFESRVLGPLKLTLDGNIGFMDAQVSFDGERVGARIEIAQMDQLRQSVVNDIDMVLESLEFIDGLARETVSAGVQNERTTPGRLFRNWEQWGRGRNGDTEKFLDALRPSHIFIQPDGGLAQPVRVIMTYTLADAQVKGDVAVNFLEPHGPQLAD